MSERDPSRQMQQIESQWREDGTLPDDSADRLQEFFGPSEGREQYHRWLLLERLSDDVEGALVERLQRPSQRELARGAQAVLKRLASAAADTVEATDATATTETASEVVVPDADELEATEPLLSTPEDAGEALDSGGSASAGQGAGLWPRLLPLYIGACSMMALLLVMRQLPQLLPEGAMSGIPPITAPVTPASRRPARTTSRPVSQAPRHRPYAGAKGAVSGGDPAWLRLFFGVSAADQAQPQRRGRSGLRVLPGEWLYFMFEKPRISGFLTLLEVKKNKGRRQLSQLFPAVGQSAWVAASRRKWVLSVGKVALRLQVPRGRQRLSFVGMLTPQPLSRSMLQRLRQLITRTSDVGWGGEQQARLARVIGASPRRIDGFWVQVQATSAKASPGRRTTAPPQR